MPRRIHLCPGEVVGGIRTQSGALRAQREQEILRARPSVRGRSTHPIQFLQPKDPLQQVGPRAGGRVQQPVELALRQHHRRLEAPVVQADQAPDLDRDGGLAIHAQQVRLVDAGEQVNEGGEVPTEVERRIRYRWPSASNTSSTTIVCRPSEISALTFRWSHVVAL